MQIDATYGASISEVLCKSFYMGHTVCKQHIWVARLRVCEYRDLSCRARNPAREKKKTSQVVLDLPCAAEPEAQMLRPAVWKTRRRAGTRLHGAQLGPRHWSLWVSPPENGPTPGGKPSTSGPQLPTRPNNKPSQPLKAIGDSTLVLRAVWIQHQYNWMLHKASPRHKEAVKVKINLSLSLFLSLSLSQNHIEYKIQ